MAMELMTKVYFIYSFIAFYSLFLFILLYFKHRKKMFYYPKPNREYSVSCVVPCYNEEKGIEQTIEGLVNNGYSGIKQIIVVDDCSTDNSFEIIKKCEKKYPDLVLALQTPKNTGNAAGAKNYGAKFATEEIMICTDGDSAPEPGAIEKMVGWFNEENVGAVTATIFVKNRTNILLRLQALEYMMIKFSRKLLEYLDSIYVTPGPLVAYRKKYFDELGGFDEKNMTEDVELTWKFLKANYEIRMSVPARVYALSPETFKVWYKQRVRWTVGGLQTLFKYWRIAFRKNMLGYFVWPLFASGFVVGILGLGLLVYRLFTWVISKYLKTQYAMQSNINLVNLADFQLNPDILFFFGMILFVLGFIFMVISLFHEKEEKYNRPKIFDVFIYMIFYLITYPIIMIVSMYKMIRGEVKW